MFLPPHYFFLRAPQAPIFEMDCFHHFITPSLHNAWSGWGVSVQGAQGRGCSLPSYSIHPSLTYTMHGAPGGRNCCTQGS